MTTAKYLVTGGAGFIGSHLAGALVERGETVRVLDNLATGSPVNLRVLEGHVQFVQGDLRNRDTIKAAAQGVEVIFHLGAIPSVPRSIAEPVASLESNINGTQNVLLAARDAGVRRVVYASSSSVYGDTPVLPKSEEMPTNPQSPYAIHKLTGELLCRVFTQIYGLETVVLRYFNVFGPRQDPNSQYAAVIPRFVMALLEKRRPAVFGDGEQTRDFTYIENVVQANLLAARAPEAVGRVMNIGCGEQISLNTVLRLAGELLEVPAQADYREARPGDVKHSLADIRLAEHLLGYRPTVRFQEGLARTIDALRATGN